MIPGGRRVSLVLVLVLAVVLSGWWDLVILVGYAQWFLLLLVLLLVLELTKTVID